RNPLQAMSNQCETNGGACGGGNGNVVFTVGKDERKVVGVGGCVSLRDTTRKHDI
ncbi:hypothetical protein A2U01_0084865, partial [Trifolium medium]|nr:hypothetical protein [Trifolium medium]